MKRRAADFIPLVLMAGFVFFRSLCLFPFPKEDLRLFLPEAKEAAGWSKDRGLLRYTGEDLFHYINGGAEIYHEYGFKEVIVQDFKKDSHSLSVEIFEMTDPQSAYGIYSFKRSPEGIPPGTKSEGSLEGYYLNMWKSRYLITITGFDEERQTIEGLKDFAKAIEVKIKTEKDTKPDLLQKLPEKALIAGSEKYFRGNLGLYNSYPFCRQDIFGLSEGVKGSYEEGYDIFIIRPDENLRSVDRFERAKEYFLKEEKYTNGTYSSCSFSVVDGHNQLLYFESSSGTILIVVGAQNLSQAAKITGRIKE